MPTARNSFIGDRMKALFIIIGITLPFFLPQAQSAEAPAPYQQLGREIFRELIETDTTHSHGDTTKAAELLAKRFRAAGFPEADIKIIGPGPTNKNVIVRYR